MSGVAAVRRRLIRGMAMLVMVGLAACHDAAAPPLATPRVHVSEHVLEHMGQGGRVRPVIYTPPADLSRPEPAEQEPPFPGPETGEAEPPPEPRPPTGGPDPGAGALEPGAASPGPCGGVDCARRGDVRAEAARGGHVATLRVVRALST